MGARCGREFWEEEEANKGTKMWKCMGVRNGEWSGVYGVGVVMVMRLERQVWTS